MTTDRTPIAFDPHSERERLEDVASWLRPEETFNQHFIRYGGHRIAAQASGESALELGCSTGVMTEILARRFHHLVVVDGSAAFLARARERVGDGPTYVEALFEEFEPGELAPFDAIVATHVLEHVDDPVTLLRRASSWLAPRGQIHVVVPNAGSLHRRVGQKMGLLGDVHDLHERDRALGHRRVYDRRALLDDVSAAGLTVTSIEGIFLKPLSNEQMREWSPELIEAFFKLGQEMPDLSGELYVICGTSP